MFDGVYRLAEESSENKCHVSYNHTIADQYKINYITTNFPNSKMLSPKIIEDLQIYCVQLVSIHWPNSPTKPIYKQTNHLSISMQANHSNQKREEIKRYWQKIIGAMSIQSVFHTKSNKHE